MSRRGQMTLLSTRLPMPRGWTRPSAAQVLRDNYGLVVDQSRCARCQRIIREGDYPANACPGCGCYFPRRCATRGCDALTHPTEHQGRSYQPMSTCRECQGDTPDALVAAFESVVSADVARAADTYQLGQPHRVQLDATLRQWLETRCGTAGPDARPWVYVHGPTSSGHLAAVARAARYARRSGLVRSLIWVREYDLQQAYKRQYDRVAGDLAAARTLVERCKSVGLLVVEHLFDGGEWTGAAATGMGALLDGRAKSRRPTALIAFGPPRHRGIDQLRQFGAAACGHFDRLAQVAQAKSPEPTAVQGRLGGQL